MFFHNSDNFEDKYFIHPWRMNNNQYNYYNQVYEKLWLVT